MKSTTVQMTARALAANTASWSDARSNGAALGRTLAAHIKARAIASEQMNRAAATEIELSLLLAAGGDEVAASALQELHLDQEGIDGSA